MSLSWDGLVLAVGGPGDNDDVGAAWVFEFDISSKGYIQIGSKLVGKGYTGVPIQGKE